VAVSAGASRRQWLPDHRARVELRGRIVGLSPPSRHFLAVRNVTRLKLFGGLSIETDAGPLTGRAAQRRRLALLALLAPARARGSAGVSRDKLIAYLWPDASAENGRHFLSDSVYRINQALAGDAIVAAGDELRLDAARLPSDVAEFEDAIARGEHERAVSCYAGPFLDGFFLSDAPELERWVEGQRDRLAREYARALEALAGAAAKRGDRAVAVHWWRRLAAHDPYSSRIALRLMQALDAAGDRAEAIQHAGIHEQLVEEELEMQPDAAVREMAEKLKAERGSRFVGRGSTDPQEESAAVAPVLSQVESRDSSAVLVASAPLRRRRGVRVVLLSAVLGVLSVAVAGLWWRERARERSAALPVRTIAVLPFANLSAEPENDYFSDGITEELITLLGKVEGLAVASRTSSFSYKNRPVDVRDVGRRLGVGAVVEGSVRKSGSRIRITAQLVSTANGYELWSDAYDREMEDVLAIQEEISRAIVGRLTGTLADPTRIRLAEASTQDPAAYDLYLKGRFAWHERTRDGLRRAVEFFEQAVAKAPNYARAYVGLADAYAVSAFYDYLAPRDAYPKAEAAARRALELDATLAAPHATMGYVLTYYHLDWSRAEEEFKRALALDPGYSTAHQWYANLLTAAARFDEAEREMRLAQEADPLSLIANAALGWSFYYAQQYEAALAQCERTLAMNPGFELAHLWGGWALDAMGRTSEAREWIGRAVQLSRGTVLTRLALAHALAGGTGPARDSAQGIVREVESRGALGEYIPSYEIAKVHLVLGDRPAALQWLERAEHERSHSRAFLRVDPQLAPLRGDPRFEAIVRRVWR
jgi:TolB-like protein/DNA-binding SARP family transcriptional activator/Tfp pilus assembly protein PilF